MVIEWDVCPVTSKLYDNVLGYQCISVYHKVIIVYTNTFNLQVIFAIISARTILHGNKEQSDVGRKQSNAFPVVYHLFSPIVRYIHAFTFELCPRHDVVSISMISMISYQYQFSNFNIMKLICISILKTFILFVYHTHICYLYFVSISH